MTCHLDRFLEHIRRVAQHVVAVLDGALVCRSDRVEAFCCPPQTSWST
jgi:hypothetical protein